MTTTTTGEVVKVNRELETWRLPAIALVTRYCAKIDTIKLIMFAVVITSRLVGRQSGREGSSYHRATGWPTTVGGLIDRLVVVDRGSTIAYRVSCSVVIVTETIAVCWIFKCLNIWKSKLENKRINCIKNIGGWSFSLAFLFKLWFSTFFGPYQEFSHYQLSPVSSSSGAIMQRYNTANDNT